MKIGDKSVQAHIYNTDGKPDLSVAAPLPEIKTVKPQSRIETKPCINWQMGNGTALLQSLILWHLDKSFSKERSSCKSGGPLSKLLDELGANKVLRFDVVKDAQLALNMPVPYPSLDKSTAKIILKSPFYLL